MNNMIMPDVVTQVRSRSPSALRWVGMDEIKLPLLVDLDSEATQTVSATVNCYVSLVDPVAKGIHMSRLYLLLEKFSEAEILNKCSIFELLDKMVSCHQGLSNAARVVFEFDYYIKRQSLISSYQGWSHYPLRIDAKIVEGKPSIELSVNVDYSSTCPCSASLSRQLIQKAFFDEFSENKNFNFESVYQWISKQDGIVATPHSQRSTVTVCCMLTETSQEIPAHNLIGKIEEAIKTPVQAVVKREDEQEFARLNGQNPQFCEDAARAVNEAVNTCLFSQHHSVKVIHRESLHKHNAVVETDSDFS